jgi:hypothetical protein
MTAEPRQQPPGQFSGMFIFAIVLLVVVYAAAMCAALVEQ